MDVRVGLWRKLNTEELMLWTVVLEKTLESPKEIQPVHCKGDQSWVFIGKINSEAETPILWPPDVKDWLIRKDPDVAHNHVQGEEEKEQKAGGEGDDRGWDGWMASLTRWTWVWVSSGSWWWTGKPAVLQSIVLQKAGHDWVTELNWTLQSTKIVNLLACDPRFLLHLPYFLNYHIVDIILLSGNAYVSICLFIC